VERYLLLLAILAAACLAQSAPASSRPSATQSRPHHRAMPGGERSTRGCLAKDESDGYQLVAQHGNRVKLNGVEDLSSYVGEQVKVRGAFGDAHPRSTAGAMVDPASARGKKHSGREFRVLKLDVLSQTCLTPAKKK